MVHFNFNVSVLKFTLRKGGLSNNKISVITARGVASFTQIRKCVVEKLVGFFKDFLL